MELCTGEPEILKKEEKDSSRVLMPFAGRVVLDSPPPPPTFTSVTYLVEELVMTVCCVALGSKFNATQTYFRAKELHLGVTELGVTAQGGDVTYNHKVHAFDCHHELSLNNKPSFTS